MCVVRYIQLILGNVWGVSTLFLRCRTHPCGHMTQITHIDRDAHGSAGRLYLIHVMFLVYLLSVFQIYSKSNRRCRNQSEGTKRKFQRKKKVLDSVLINQMFVFASENLPCTLLEKCYLGLYKCIIVSMHPIPEQKTQDMSRALQSPKNMGGQHCTPPPLKEGGGHN